MPKAIVVAVGDTPLNPLNDLLKQNSISSNVIDAATSSVDEIVKFIRTDDQAQCLLLKGVSSLCQHIPRIADATKKLVLLYCSPATALGNALEISNGKVKPEQVINRWQESLCQTMKLAEDSGLYSLCDLNDVLEHSSLFLKEFFAIETSAESKPSTYTKRQLANHLATLYLFEQDDAFALYDEALSIGKLYGEFTVHLGPDTDEIKQSATDSGQSVFKQLISNHQEIQSKHNEIESLKAQKSEKVNALEKQLAELQHTKAAFEENSVQLQEELTKNKELAEQQASKIEALQDSKQNIEIKLQAVTDQIEKSKNEMTALASELSAKEASLTENQDRQTNLQTQLQGKEQRNTQLLSQIEELKASTAKLHEELSQQRQVIAENDKDKVANTAALQELGNKLRSVNQQASTLNLEKVELTDTVQQLKEQLANQQSVIEEKEKESKAAKKSLQDTQQQFQSAKTNVTELNAQQDELTSKIEQLEEQIQSLQIVIEEKQEAITLKDSAIIKYENQLNTSHQKISQLETNLVELQTQHQEVMSGKDKKFAALSNSLTQAQTALEESTSSLVKFKEENTVTSQEFELATIQVAQLQEELESTFAELQRARDTEALHEDARSKLSAVTQQIEQLIQDKELAELQISQLQEELELVTVQKADLEAASSSNENVIPEKSKQIELLTKTNEELIAQSSSLKQQVEAATKRKGLEEQAIVNELQSQLEQQLKQTHLLKNSNARLQEQLKQAEAGMSQSNEFQQAELQLASLQISQLQKELEYYYNAWQEAQQNGTQVIKMGKHHQKVFSKAQAESLVVTGKYREDGYQDLHLLLSEVQLGDGREFAELQVKLVNINSHVGIEFRDSSDGGLFKSYDDAIDDYGPYLRYFAKPPAGEVGKQKVTNGRMIASERLLVMSVINLVADLLQGKNIDCHVKLENSEWRSWRLGAIQLANYVTSLPNWLSFDSVVLKEEFRTEGYEHLWIQFNHVLMGNVWQKKLELKLAALELTVDNDDIFCQRIALEFRELEDGTAPLLTWPPETSDEFGLKFVVPINQLEVLDDVAAQDKQLITQVTNNLPSILEKIDESQVSMQRSKAQWKSTVQYLLENKEAPVLPEQQIREALILGEVVSMGSYQHIAFDLPESDLKIKLQAQNVNPDTFDAELYLELRNGNHDVLYHDTEFFGEDEYGPRVQIPAEALLGELSIQRNDEFAWAIQLFNTTDAKLNNSDLDELVKRLWLNILNRKRSLN